MKTGDKYAVRYLGVPPPAYKDDDPDEITQLATLNEEGLVVVDLVHLVTVLLPDVGEQVEEQCSEQELMDGKRPSQQRQFTQQIMQYLVVPGASFSQTMMQSGVHWALSADRLTRFFASIARQGVDMTPIPGDKKVAVTSLMLRFLPILQSLPHAERLIDTKDVLAFDTFEGAGTGTWYDFATPAVLIGSDTNALVVSHFQGLTPCHFTRDGRESETFTSCCKQLVAGTGLELAKRSPMAQAADVIRFVRATRPPAELEYFVCPLTAPHEIARRASKTAADRFRPLFEDGWRRAYEPLNQLWPKRYSGAEATEQTALLAASMGIATSEGITSPLVLALCDALKGFLLEPCDCDAKPAEGQSFNAFRSEAALNSHRSRGGKARMTLYCDASLLSTAMTGQSATGEDGVVTARKAIEDTLEF